MLPWEGGKQGRGQDQPAAAHNRINEACQERGEGDKNPFHRPIFAPCCYDLGSNAVELATALRTRRRKKKKRWDRQRFENFAHLVGCLSW